MSTATLAGHRATRARVHLPAWGVWYADVALDAEATLSGAVALELADLSLSGAVLSGGPSKGRSHYRIVGGAGGWGRVVPGLSYANDAGVKASTVLQDAASAAGETIDASTLPTSRVGPFFVRESAPAARVLDAVAPHGWHVGEDGVTRIRLRPAADLSVQATRGPLDPARGTVTLAAESIATVLPGVRVDGLQAVDVLHEVSADGGLRSTLWGATGGATTSRRAQALGRLLEALDPARRFRAVYEYRVVTQEGERLNLQPVRVSVGMPDLKRVHVRPGVAGVRADVALGSLVLVGFVNADPARPYVCGFEDAEGEGFAPDRLDLVGVADDVASVPDPVGRVVRYGDSVSVAVSGAVATGPVLPAAAPVGTYSRVHA